MTDVLQQYTTPTGVTITVYVDGSVTEEWPDPPVRPKNIDDYRREITAENLRALTPDEMTAALTQMHEDAVNAIPYYANALQNWATLTVDEKDRLLYNLARSMLASIRYLTGKLT